ncbi:MAG: hypothetical protein Q7R41_13470 [Phycisphaerales bacterium]|nr:hypothetical protein [Phycisphaerales bacterium]
MISLIAAPLGSLTLWLALEHRPGWYAPAVLDEQGVQAARRDATNAVDQFGDQLVRRQPFEVVLRDDALNAWLTAMPSIWPDAARAVPRELHDPALRFESGLLRIGALYEVSGWRAIVSGAAAAALAADGATIELRLVETCCGSVPMPPSLIARAANPHLHAAAMSDGKQSSAPETPHGAISSIHEVRSVEQLYRGVRIRNRFVWPNGKRPFRIDQITIDAGELRLRIEPINGPTK